MTEREKRVLGAIAEDGRAALMDRETAARWLPRRKEDGHKGDFGKVFVIGGSVGFTGAPVLAARGALRCGAGLVTVLTRPQVYPIVAANCLEAMARPLPEEVGETLALLRGADAVLLGPGLGRGEGQTELALSLTRELTCPLILDADGINILAGHMDILDGRAGPAVLTPHEGEFARLGGDVSRGRLAGARAFAEEHRCVLVLKGHDTVTALPDGACRVNANGNSGMATGGSGDVLGGMILSLLGQGLTPERAAALAVYLHGRAGDLAAADKGEHGMLPSDLIEQIPYAIKELVV
ncbi:MAG: NAD(P)H-hydrate dehydratase [Candidatus Enterenecus sp.]